MSWLLLTITAALSFSASVLIDKFLLASLKHPYTINVVGSLFGGTLGLIILAAFPRASTPNEIASGLVVGVLGFLAVMFYLMALKREEASRVSPLWSFVNILVPLLAFLFLGEPLGPRLIAAMIFIILGSLILEADHGKTPITHKRNVVVFMALASFSWAIGILLARLYVSNGGTVSFWALNLVGTGIAAIATLPFLFRHLGHDVKNGRTVLAILASMGTESIGVLGIFLALSRAYAAPVQLVSSASQYLFIFLITLASSRWFPKFIRERTDWRTVRVKLVALTLVIIGLVLAGGGE